MTSSIAQSFTAQYEALQGAAATFDRSLTHARLMVSGPDRQSWLQGLLTNDIAALAPGQGCYAAYLTPQGRMIGDMRVFNRGDDLVMDVTAESRATLVSRLDQFIIMEDVTLADVSSEVGCVAVAGPSASRDVAAATGLDASSLDDIAEYDQLPVEVDGVTGFCALSLELAVPSFEIYLPLAAAAHLRRSLEDAGVQAIGQEALTTARIEAGRPRFGADMNEETIPLEAGIESRAISFTKGCYVGQEVVIRVLHRGQGRVARRLCWIVSDEQVQAEGHALPLPWAPGARLSVDDKVVGRLTSACASPQRKRLLAIGLVNRDAFAPGTKLSVGDAGDCGDATVEALPGRSPAA